MQLARSNNTPAAVVRRSLNRVRRALLRTPDPEPWLARRLVELELELDNFAFAELAALPDGRPSPSSGNAPSMLKLIGTELHQKVHALGVEIACLGGAPALAAGDLDDPELDAAQLFMAKHLAGRLDDLLRQQ